MKTTAYFREQVLRKRPYLKAEWCGHVVKRPLAREVQPGRQDSLLGAVPELQGRVLRVVTLEDGETIHNAFPDRNFGLPQAQQE